jgi:hypothetical protein
MSSMDKEGFSVDYPKPPKGGMCKEREVFILISMFPSLVSFTLIGSPERQKGLTTSHVDILLDPLAYQQMISCNG